MIYIALVLYVGALCLVGSSLCSPGHPGIRWMVAVLIAAAVVLGRELLHWLRARRKSGPQQ